MSKYQNKIVEALKNGSRIQCNNSGDYKAWLIHPNGGKETIRRDTANKVILDYEDKLVFGEYRGISWKSRSQSMWKLVTDVKPPKGIVIKTKREDAGKVINEQYLKWDGKIWWLADGSMAAYYTPTHWEVQLSNRGNILVDQSLKKEGITKSIQGL